MDFLDAARTRFAPALAAHLPDGESVESSLDLIRPAKDPQFGDFQANFCMPLAKRAKRNPRELAAEIVAAANLSDLFADPEVAGPGFINLRVDDDRLAAETATLVADDRLGVPVVESPQTITVDFSSPNVAKPMHVGHLRTTVIGDAVCRILRLRGHNVIGDNHLGDWGTQFGMILYGYKNFRDQAAYEADPVTELARLYRTVNTLSDHHAAKSVLPRLEAAAAASRQTVAETPPPADKPAKKRLSKLKQEANAAAETLAAAAGKMAAVDANPALASLAAAHPEIAEASRAETAKLHAGDAENRRLWEEFIPPCLAALQTLYDRLDIEHDAVLGESFYQPMLADVVDELLAKGVAEESDGAVVVRDNVDPAGKSIPGPFVIRKSDGAFLYGTTDLATVKHHVEELKADAMLYVVDSRQGDHFANVAATARRWGYMNTDFRHVSFGTVLGEDRKPFKTRSGDTIGLESLLDEAVERALAIVSDNDDAKPDGPELDAAERQDVAEAVGLGGIKYADLAHNRESDYVFSWDKMLSTTGNTATYMQYAHARVCGIFRRGGVDRDALRAAFVADGGDVLLTEPAERAMALQLNRFAESVREASRDHRPNVLTDYLFETAKAFQRVLRSLPGAQSGVRSPQNQPPDPRRHHRPRDGRGAGVIGHPGDRADVRGRSSKTKDSRTKLRAVDAEVLVLDSLVLSFRAQRASLREPRENHPPAVVLQHAGHLDLHLVALLRGGFFADDHRAVVQVAHALPRGFAALLNLQTEAVAGQVAGLEGVGDDVQVYAADAAGGRGPGEILVVRHQPPAQFVGQRQQPMLRGGAGEVFAGRLDADVPAGQVAEFLQHVQPPAAAGATGFLRAVGDGLDGVDHEIGDHQHGVGQPRLGESGDAAVDQCAVVQHQRTPAFQFTAKLYVRDDKAELPLGLQQERDAEVHQRQRDHDLHQPLPRGFRHHRGQRLEEHVA